MESKVSRHKCFRALDHTPEAERYRQVKLPVVAFRCAGPVSPTGHHELSEIRRTTLRRHGRLLHAAMLGAGIYPKSLIESYGCADLAARQARGNQGLRDLENAALDSLGVQASVEGLVAAVENQ